MRWIYLKAAFLFWFGAIWVALGLTLLAVGATQLLRSDADASVVAAQVVEKGRDADSYGVARHWLRYSWTDGFGAQAGLTAVDEPTWRQHEEGDAIVVELGADGRSRVRSSQEGPLAGALFTGIGLLFAGLGLAFSAHAWRRAGRRARVIAEGLTVPGVVESVDRNLRVRINGHSPQFFTFRWRDEIGRDRVGRSPDLPRRLEDRWRPGDGVRVVYDPLEPEACEADVFELRSG